MSLKAGFAEIDITPPPGTHKIGWLKEIVSDRVLDPLSTRTVILECKGRKVAFIQLDTLSIRWTQVADMRRRIEEQYGFPGAHIMIAATHNHAGPAVANVGDVRRDDEYVETLVKKVVAVFGKALENLQEARIGLGSCFQFDVSHNRRVVMRDGTARTHGGFDTPDALYVEGPIDPEVAVLAARGKDDALLGAVVNFACHPTHHGDETALSAGYPGVLAREMRSNGCPVTLFLNGASGNISSGDPYRDKAAETMEEIGAALAEDAGSVVESMDFRNSAELGCRSRTIELPFRQASEDEMKGTIKGAQRFVDPAIYDRDVPKVLERIRRRGTQPAEVQAVFIDEYAFAGIPAEYFVQNGLRIKERAYPRHALVVSHANGMVGYVPHKEAFLRGGYETTFAGSSRLAPEAGEMLADCAVELIRKGS